MGARARLTLLFTCITAAILLIFGAVLYFSSKQNRQKEFYDLLKKEAVTKANLFFEAGVDAKVLQNIYHNNRKIINEVEVAIYTHDFHLLYHDAVDIDVVKEDLSMIDRIYHKGEVQFYLNDWQVIGIRHTYKGQTYIITAAAYDQYGYNKLANMLWVSIVVFVISILLIYGAGRFFSRRAFAPVQEMTERARQISTTSLHMRLDTGHSKDELTQLAETFNDLLDRLENSFDAQKQFVSNVAHELRTPLAAITAELELSTSRERSVAEYQEVIRNTLNDAKKLGRLATSLLDFAKATYDPVEISFKPVRVDEILLDAQLQVQKVNKNYRLSIHFEQEFENDKQISVKGNSYLLTVAFANLFENGCKFSDDKQCRLIVSFTKAIMTLRFSDQGIGIPEEDLQHIFTPFFRGQNKMFADGNGIGLPLTKKIISLHTGDITVISSPHAGTTFTVILPVLD
ncbi:ATP-binding protein [Sphingobacterium spiritivorum]|uniref:sensor histidine kinase n=1 Tax=Sphingobacterium spiritivorum TaxID=258 RepID=UPI003DA5B1CA